MHNNKKYEDIKYYKKVKNVEYSFIYIFNKDKKWKIGPRYNTGDVPWTTI